jgi:hypothetical protein
MVAHEVCQNMAQTTVPVYLSGKLGSMVYTGNRQGTAVRMLVTPKNPETGFRHKPLIINKIEAHRQACG